MIRVVLPTHLRNLAKIDGDVELDVGEPVTQRSVIDALEERYPMLRGTMRDQVTHQRRPFVRFFACEQDVSHESADAPLPDAVATGAEPLLVVGAIAGGCTGKQKLRSKDARRNRDLKIFRANDLGRAKSEDIGEPCGSCEKFGRSAEDWTSQRCGTACRQAGQPL